MEGAEGLSCLICMFSYLINYSNAVTYYIPEQAPVGFKIGNIANDVNISSRISPQDFNDLEYYFADANNEYIPYFNINSSTSDLTVGKTIDREEICEFTSEVSCTMQIKVAAAATIGDFFDRFVIDINIEDINDNAPYFTVTSVSLTFSESDVPGTAKPVDGATDKDSLNFSIKGYSIIPSDSPFAVDFDLDSETVQIVIAKKLDREVQDFYIIELVAYDHGFPSLNGSLLINITVLDTNDNSPIFNQSIYNVTVKENNVTNTTIVRVSATDLDAGDNAKIVYSLSDQQPTEIREAFQMNETTGELKVVGQLEYAPDKIYRVLVVATDMGERPKSSDAYVHVFVEDSENNKPIIRISPRPFGFKVAEISEYAVVGAAVALVDVTDDDSERNGVVSCSTNNPYFILQLLEAKVYTVNVLSPLNYEEQMKHNVSIFCHDFGIPQLNSSAFFIVNVVDENDNYPVFDGPYTSRKQENNPVGDFVLQVHADDKDSGDNGRVSYSLKPNSMTDFFIDKVTGMIFANKSFDYEIRNEKVLEFEVIAQDAGNPSKSNITKVVVTIVDVNDNIPMFADDHVTYYVQESDNKETVLGKLSANDADDGMNGFVSYSLVDENSDLPFVVIPDGTLKTKEKMDRESIPTYNFVVIATDNGAEKRLTSSINVTVVVADINDNNPIIRYPQDFNLVKQITFMTPPQTQVMTIQAYDLDEGKNAQLMYTYIERNDTHMFQLGRNGEIYVSRTMTEEDVGVYLLKILVSDRGEEPRSASTQVTIIVLDRNGTAIVTEPPEIESQNVIIAVVVVVVTAVMAAAILLVIWIMRRLDLNKRKYMENGHSQQSQSECNGPRSPNGISKVKTIPVPVISQTVMTKSKSSKGDSAGIDNRAYQNASPAGEAGNQGTDGTDSGPGHSSQKLHRLASFKVQQALLQSHNRQWPSQNDLCEPGKDTVIRKPEDLHSDLSADTGTFDSGIGGSVSDTGDARLAQLQQIVRQSGRRGQPPHKPNKPPRIIARGRSEVPEKTQHREPAYHSFSPTHLSPSQTPSHFDRRDMSPTKFSHPSSPTKFTNSTSPTRIHMPASPTKFNIQNSKVNLTQDLLMYKRFQNGLKPTRKGLVEDSVDTTYRDDDESTTSGSYYIDNTADDIHHMPVSDIYV